MIAINGFISERELAEEMFRLAVEACPSGMVMIADDGNMVMVNTEIENQFGYTREELIGRQVEMLVPERLRSRHSLHRRNFMPTPEARRMGGGRELFGLRKDGSEFPVEVGLNPISAGDHLLVLGVIVDISQRKQNERLKDEFVATVSHELRTPLTSISAALGLLAGQWSEKLPDAAARLLSIAHNNSNRLVRLINDILDIEKLESAHVVFNSVKVDLRQLAEQALEDNRSFAEAYGVQVRLDPASVRADVNADPDRLAQVVANLLSNAIKFSPAGSEVLVAAEKHGDAFRLSVRDHGPGIPEQFKRRIFEKFAQADGTNSRQKGGTGLGLSIVKQIVERLGGEVGFDDAPGGGTIFHVDLPAWDGTAGSEIDVAAEGTAPRLLICEDDPAVAKTVRIRLRHAGFTVDFAHTFETAIARSGTNRFAAIIVDLRLRDSDGLDLILRIRAQPHHSDTPIIVVSGDPERGRSDVRSSELKILEWISKPIDFNHLIAVLLNVASAGPRRRRRILHVDDDPDILAAVAGELRAMAEVTSANSAESARRALAAERIDLVVLDISLGQDSGLDLLPDIHDSSGNRIPVIIFSSQSAIGQVEGQVDTTLSKMNSSLENLGNAVRDRLALLPRQLAKEVA